jgi:hypothetical protein
MQLFQLKSFAINQFAERKKRKKKQETLNFFVSY